MPTSVAPPLPEGLRDFTWQAFTPDTSEEIAAARFQDRHGRPPEYILESLNNLLAGPIPVTVAPFQLELL